MSDVHSFDRAAAVPLAPPAPWHVRMRGLGKDFVAGGATVAALQGVDLTILKGQFCCIVGPSGCGKTTLLRIVAGLETHTAGELEIAHFERSKPLHSMVFQDQSVFPWMSVERNVEYGLRMRGVPATQRRDIVSHYIDKVGLGAFRHAYPHQLSGGMKQRVSIARAFANDPEILLMDEPFAALDEQNKAILQEELLRIWEESRKTVLFITHSIDEALVLSDRALIMTARPGRLKADVPVTLQRPRGAYEIRASEGYGELSRTLWSALREEVQGATREVAP
ncbi:ABC transporter ATP-binding protein [Caenimonas sp. DR4.4]|uniref:ABC transporter ATP-binding protein n=2 Tax=Caenimonas aquaedulcis TaxID=2793270 RepID=A0A931H8I5_9BURK|nr:ABC transporter ATP-binding protein [Caenimonas aquaedulcis]